jgi:hypothetical protein
MTETVEVELTQDEIDERDYLAAFAEVNGSEEPSAEDTDGEASVADPEESTPDDKDPDEGEEQSPPAKGEASDVTPDGKDDPYAWIDNLPEDVREQAKALRHKFVSTNGRISAYQSRLDAAESEVAALRSVTRVRKKKADTGTNPTEEKELSPKLKEFAEKYPQLAETLQELIAAERAEVEGVIDERLTPLTEERAVEQAKSARQALADGASEIFDTPNTGVHYKDVINSELYKNDFLAAQSEEYRQMARTTSDPETALMIMRQFMDFAHKYAQDNGIVEGKENPASGSKADKTNARRQANKRGAGTPPPKSAVTDPTMSGSYEDDFARFSAQ